MSKSSFPTIPSLLLALLALGSPSVAVAQGAGIGQGGGRVVESEGLRIAYYVADDTYQLSADNVLLEQVIGRLAEISGATFSAADELHHVPVVIETERVALSVLLEQLRATIAANLILATTREQQVSRVWFTAASVNIPTSPLVSPVAAAGGAAPAPGPGTGGALPLPQASGNELQAAGFDPSVDMAEYIRNQSASSAGSPPGAPAGEGQASNGDEQPAPAGPPIPMSPNALENFFAGDSTTKTYHRLNCVQAMYLPSVNKIWFQSRQEAIAAGYTPHDICLAK